MFASVPSASGVAVTPTHVLVSDFDSGDIHAFDKSGRLVTTLKTGATPNVFVQASW